MNWGQPSGDRRSLTTLYTVAPAATPASTDPTPPQLDRYRPLKLLGQGGMGEVWQVHDRTLDRTVAMKVIRPELADPAGLRSFREEARLAARLQHPGIVPVHELGELPDGRAYFTMAEVEGQTLEVLLQQVHRDWRLDATHPARTPRRILEAFLRVCETVAFAHHHQLVHRDLKPSNIMVGAYGEVLVLDWGLALALRPATVGGAHVVGTPAYMSPEQARGQGERVGPPADVFALGATLYDLLCERPPRLERTAEALLARIALGSPIEPPSVRGALPGTDPQLDAICLRALAHDPGQRPPHAGALAAELSAWLDGSAKRQVARGLVQHAGELLRLATAAQQEADRLDAEARATLEALPAPARPADKSSAWARQDAAKEASRAAIRQRSQAMQELRSALTHAPDLVEAHAALADELRRRHAEHEAAGRAEEAIETEAALADHDRQGRHAAYLSGTGAVTLITDPPGAEVRLHRVEERDRRLVPVFDRILGATPLRAQPLEMGNYLLTLHHPGRAEVRYPVQIARQHHWDGVPPGASAPLPIALPWLDALAPDDCYVPAGWAWIGSPDLPDALPFARVWVEPFVIKRFPVTLAEYLAYLDHLVGEGDDEAVEAAQPRLSDSDEPFLDRGPGGRFVGITAAGQWREVLPDTDQLPMVLVDHHQAMMYARWRSARDARPWSLPTEIEWQKAGRGIDGRPYPWGHHFEPSWCRMRETGPVISVVSVHDHPEDVSIYGARSILGNVFEWALAGRTDPEAAQFLGACCGSTRLTCRLAWALPATPDLRRANLGFRLVQREKIETPGAALSSTTTHWSEP